MSIIKDILAKATPQQRQRVRDRLLLAVRIADALEAKGWSQKQLAEKLGKQPSEISKWLSGTHNFTIDTLSDLSQVLDVKLLFVKEETPRVVTKEVVKFVAVTIPATRSGQGAEPVPFAHFQQGIGQPINSAYDA